MKKRIMSLLLAVVMCVGLAAPALAASVPALEPDAIGSVETPRYAGYEVLYTIDLENNTYAVVTFTVSEKGANTYFEDVLSLSFYTTNPKGSHWKIWKGISHPAPIHSQTVILCLPKCLTITVCPPKTGAAFY